MDKLKRQNQKLNDENESLKLKDETANQNAEDRIASGGIVPDFTERTG